MAGSLDLDFIWHVKNYLGEELYQQYRTVKSRASVIDDVEFFKWLLTTAENVLDNAECESIKQEILKEKRGQNSNRDGLTIVHEVNAIFGCNPTPSAVTADCPDKYISINTPYTDPQSQQGCNGNYVENLKSPVSVESKKRQQVALQQPRWKSQIISYCSICKSNIKMVNKFNSHICRDNPRDIQEMCLLHRCVYCSEVFQNVKTARSHIYRIHLRAGQDSFVICQVCGKNVKTYSKKKHDRTHTQVVRERCRQCSAKFRQKSMLNFHIKVKHNGLRYHCDQCDKCYRSNASLKLHKLKHIQRGKISLFPCDICSKVFTSHRSLKRHKVSHEMRHLCSFCGLSFSAKSTLDLHTRVHTSECPFVCEYENCFKSFKQKSVLTEHIRQIHTKETPFACNMCNKKFVTSSKLNRHMRSVHSVNTNSKNKTLSELELPKNTGNESHDSNSVINNKLLTNLTNSQPVERRTITPAAQRFILPKYPLLVDQIDSHRLLSCFQEQRASGGSQGVAIVGRSEPDFTTTANAILTHPQNIPVVPSPSTITIGLNRCAVDSLREAEGSLPNQLIYNSMATSQAVRDESEFGTLSAVATSAYRPSGIIPNITVPQLSLGLYPSVVAANVSQEISPTHSTSIDQTTISANAPECVEDGGTERIQTNSTQETFLTIPSALPLPQGGYPAYVSVQNQFQPRLTLTTPDTCEGDTTAQAVAVAGLTEQQQLESYATNLTVIMTQSSPSPTWAHSIDTLLMAASRNSNYIKQQSPQ